MSLKETRSLAAVTPVSWGFAGFLHLTASQYGGLHIQVFGKPPPFTPPSPVLNHVCLEVTTSPLPGEYFECISPARKLAVL